MTIVQQPVSFPPWRREHLPAATAQEHDCVSIPKHADATTTPFTPLDRDIVSDAIPAFFIGRDGNGFWVAREANGRIGGLFVLKRSALSFARAMSHSNGCATIFPAERFELDLANSGNPFATHLAPLLRLAGRLRSGLRT
jgi:hypothetical protein